MGDNVTACAICGIRLCVHSLEGLKACARTKRSREYQDAQKERRLLEVELAESSGKRQHVRGVGSADNDTDAQPYDLSKGRR